METQIPASQKQKIIKSDQNWAYQTNTWILDVNRETPAALEKSITYLADADNLNNIN